MRESFEWNILMKTIGWNMWLTSWSTPQSTIKANSDIDIKGGGKEREKKKRKGQVETDDDGKSHVRNGIWFRKQCIKTYQMVKTQIPEDDEAKQLVSDGVPATGWFLQEKTREELLGRSWDWDWARANFPLTLELCNWMGSCSRLFSRFPLTRSSSLLLVAHLAPSLRSHFFLGKSSSSLSTFQKILAIVPAARNTPSIIEQIERERKERERERLCR